MHILIIPSWYPTAENPINGIFFLEQAQSLKEAGHQVNILVPPILKSLKTLKRNDTFSLKPEFQIEVYQGLKTYRTLGWNWFPRPRHWFNKNMVRLYGTKAFQFYLRDEGKPDIIHAHSIFYGGYLAVQLALKNQIPIILTEHFNGFIRGTISPVQAYIAKKCLEKINKIVAVGPALKKVIQPYAPQKKIEVLGNMVDTEFFNLSDLPITPKPFVFCLIALLTPKKGIDILLQAFAKTLKNQNIVLKIAGDGTEKYRLMNLANHLNIAEQVYFLGLLSREGTRDLLHQSHALVSSSYVETFGVSLIEAMACGKPVIATRSGGPEMFVNNQNGILVPVGDVNALAEAMQTMVEHYDRYNPEQIRTECVAKFSETAIIRQLETIYQNVIESNEV